MTNELEKTFFDTFGIEPMWECIKPSDELCNECGCCELKYPQITDRILLELYCIVGDYCVITADTVSELKEKILKNCIRLQRVVDIKHQVRTLFEEEK